jgi:predicted dehydrogenase
MLRLGIIGCGRVTTMFHLQAIKSAGNINQRGKVSVWSIP